MIDIQKISKLVGLRVAPDMEQRLFSGCKNILGFLDTLQEIKIDKNSFDNEIQMSVGYIGADMQSMDANIYMSNIDHPIDNEQIMLKHKGRA